MNYGKLVFSNLCSHWSRRSRGSSSRRRRNGTRSVTVDLDSSLRALAGDVTSLTAAVAGLTSGVEGTAIRRGAVAGDVTQLAAGVALHGLSLAVSGKVVWSTTLVAGSSAVDVGQTTAETTVSTTRRRNDAATSAGTRSWTGTLFNC